MKKIRDTVLHIVLKILIEKIKTGDAGRLFGFYQKDLNLFC